MTFCIALKTEAGLVALADTQIVRGGEQLKKGKLSILKHGDESFFVMTSGLRSVRDKLVIYAAEEMEREPEAYDRLYQVANLFGRQLRRVHAEDAAALAAGGLSFNLHAIIGGRLGRDGPPTLFYLYPEGNWVEAASDSPYFMIGRTTYGRPILDRLMTADVDLSRAAALAVLAFDATRSSVTDVDFPIDVLTVAAETGVMREIRFTSQQLGAATDWWQRRLADALAELPMDWAAELLPEGERKP